ncbi:uncharacterized protein AB675_3761 [Cyphellophora attinorum]|uniref:GPI anchored protein n=1 Tax=Cyphellophora attinorum TaxID=1664694 RepID=A0A0N1NWB1_9EURO|nr:uncharacterized protein AB675_3761 [Phialophora attinorum]KPI35257.1 hypothetical protein AB675_3761 [Phialophora attinorum]
MFTHLAVLCALSQLTAAFDFPSIVPLDKRQQPGTPQYECHEDCGGVITQARTPNFCESANFTSSLDACLECAEEFNIWQYYGESVGAAAQSCGLDATPVAANATTASSSATSAATDVATSSVQTSSAATSAASATSSIAESASEQAASATSSAAVATPSGNASPEMQISLWLLLVTAGLVGLQI